ncbi:hypothetical protein THF1C08_230074 [Vibrio jasicida]|uniref:Uncharacterized protein n=1 Tax=Vibrio jasicida TaxID=766224 RepID=A0AAU9QN24_9VIBR|nr:hypothetical protein THF1C08_230074 [Vibrio jasicida]CAH1591106.1 hypothetical protein THF1A12_230072 [Vibrio jasicida]
MKYGTDCDEKPQTNTKRLGFLTNILSQKSKPRSQKQKINKNKKSLIFRRS